jgi:hypothetical protein
MSEAKTTWLPEALRPLLPAGVLRLHPGMLLVLAIGWLLSPLCWWNDLIINLPVAWVFAKAAQAFQPAWFSPGLVVGYWLSNLIGIALMQWGALGLVTANQDARNPRRDCLIGLATSTLYTVVVVMLVQIGWLPSPLPIPLS